MKIFETLMIFFYKFVCIKVREQIVNPIIVFAANFEVSKNSSTYDKKITKWRVL